MKEVLISFESEGREGIVAVGTYLIEAAKRLGIRIDDSCQMGAENHNCAMKISAGAELLSIPTRAETEILSSAALKAGERLSCQAKIEKAGEVKVMSVKKPKADEAGADEKKPAEEFKREFEAMPLEEKISSLVELEAIALGETFSFVLNSPYAAAGKVMDVLAGFGLKLEKEDREAKKPKEHKGGGKSEKEASEEKPKKTAKPEERKAKRSDKKKGKEEKGSGE